MDRLGAQAAGFVEFDAVAEGVVDEEAFPGGRAAGVDGNACGGEAGAEGIEVSAFEAEMAISVAVAAVFFYGCMEIESAGFKPQAATRADGFWFGNFAQAQKIDVKRAGLVFGAFGDGEVDVGKSHGSDQIAIRDIS